MKHLISQICRFSFVGILCFAVDYFLLLFFTEIIGMNYLISGSISFIVSVIINYILSIRYVFCSDHRISFKKELITFTLLSLFGLFINEIFMWFFVEHINLCYSLSKIYAGLLVSIYNFISRKIFLESHINFSCLRNLFHIFKNKPAFH